MGNDDNNLISNVKNEQFNQAVDNTISYIISGKTKEINDFIDFLNKDNLSANKYIKAIVNNIKTKENIREISSAVVELIKIIANKSYYKLTNQFIEGIPYNSIKAKSYTIIAEIEEEKGNNDETLKYIELALKFTEKIKSPTDKSQSIKIISLLIAKQNKFETAIKLLKSINVDSEKAHAIEKVLSLVIDEKDVNKRIQHLNLIADIAGTIKDANAKSESFILITRAMINSNMVYEALNLARQIKDQNAKISTLGVIIDLMAKSGKSWEAKAVAGEAKEAAENLNQKDKRRSQSLSEVIEAQIKLDMVDEALDISQDVKDAGWKAMNMTIIAEAMLKNNLVDRAIMLLEKSISLVEQIENFGSQSTVLSSISEVLSSIDYYDYNEQRLNQLFDKITTILKRIDDEDLIYTVLSYMSGLGIMDKYDYFKEKITDYIHDLKNDKLRNHLKSIVR
jgi:tetratricopeptide (TPR) repeat protein